MFYAVAYVLTSLASFGMIMLLSREGFEADQLDDFKGLNQRSPWWAFMMLLVMFSLAGIPPTVGFYAKFSVIQAAVDAGFVWLAVVAVLASLVGAFYYLRVVKLMYFDDATDTAPIVARARQPRAAVGQRPRAAALRHLPAAADGLVRRRAGAVRVPLTPARGGGRAGRRRAKIGRSAVPPLRFSDPGHARRPLRHLPRRPDAAVDRLRRDPAARSRRRRGLRAADADLLRPARLQLGRSRRREGARRQGRRRIRGLRLPRRAVGLVQRHDPHALRRPLRRRSRDARRASRRSPRRRAS